MPRGEEDDDAGVVEAEATTEESSTESIEAQFQALLKDRLEWRAAAKPLAIADAEATEERRVAQLRRLAERGATELLDPLHGALVWLALHQAEDGRFSDKAMRVRCKALGHRDLKKKEGSCELVHRAGSSDLYAVPATALAVLAFLDFRDQDARGVFEPHLAKAVAWLLARQKEDGSFERASREFYASAMALMALGQAATTSGSIPIKKAVERGLVRLYDQRGPTGGYRYRRLQRGDLSVTGWVTQAVEAAKAAGAEIPRGMEDDLRNFHHLIWRGGAEFRYTVGGNLGRQTLYPVGMLMGHILLEEVDLRDLDAWRLYMHEAKSVWKQGPPEYTLYYGIRIALLLDEGLKEPWATWVRELAARHEKVGGAAGSFRSSRVGMFSLAGPVVTTALAALTLEHALYER